MNIYKKQADDFLAGTKTSCEIVKAVPQKSPIWAEGKKHGIHYSVTLKNGRHTYTFDFWDSLAHVHKRARPTTYSVLTAINVEIPDNFKDFCDLFGFDNDSIKALDRFYMCREQWHNVTKLFTPDELEKLAEIQ